MTGGADATAPVAGQRRTEMQRALDTAVGEIERMTGWLDARTVPVTVSADGRGGALALPYVRLAAIGTVTSPGAMAVAPGFVDLGAGLIEVPSATRGAWTVQCAGTTWPAALQTAALEWAAHLY